MLPCSIAMLVYLKLMVISDESLAWSCNVEEMVSDMSEKYLVKLGFLTLISCYIIIIRNYNVNIKWLNTNHVSTSYRKLPFIVDLPVKHGDVP